MAESLINLEPKQFESLIETQGLDGAVEGVVQIATEDLGFMDQPITVESLKAGTHPILDQLDRYKGIAPEDRQLSSEEILTLFTNVEDYGRFDPDGSFSKIKAFAGGITETIPEAVGGFAGFKTGVAAAAPIANLIPPLGLPGLAARGAIYTIGGIGGAITGAIAGSEIDEAITGKEDPVIPSLEASRRAGETFTYGMSLLATPWRFFSKQAEKSATGALEFLDNFKNVSSGKFAQVADEAFEVTAKNAGLSQKAFDAAMKARTDATRGEMFGGALGTNLGLTKFNPAGYILDPRKGPATARIIGGVEKGIQASRKLARENPKSYLGLEATVAGGTALGAVVAQNIDPYDDATRLGSEVAFSFIIPFPVQLLVDVGKPAAKGVVGKIKEWYGKKDNVDGLMAEGVTNDSLQDIYTALQRSEEYADQKLANGEIVTADEKLAAFIDGLIESSKNPKLDANNNPITLTAADLAETSGLPLSKTVRTIQNELQKNSKELEAATGKGQEELTMGAINAIGVLAKTGDPEAVTVAARIQQALFEENILNGIDNAVTDLTTSATKVLGRAPTEESPRVDLSEKLYEVLQQQIALGKRREGELWRSLKNFPLTEFFAKNGRQIQQPNVLQLLDRPSIRGGLNFSSKGAKADLETDLGAYKADIEDLRTFFQQGQGRNPAQAEKFWLMYSGLLEKAAELKKNGLPKRARHISKVTDALLRDLTGQKNNVSAPYNAARAYTFARNNVFSRTFLSNLEATDKQRGLKLAPQELLDQFFQGNPRAVVQRYDQIQAAGKFLIKEGGFTENQVQNMTASRILEEALRDSFTQIMTRKVRRNPNNPNEQVEIFEVDPVKLANFKKRPGSKELMALLPDLQVDLQDAQSAQRAFDNFLTDPANSLSVPKARQTGFTDAQIDEYYKNQAFQFVLQYDDPGKAVSEALAAKRPVRALTELFNMIEKTSPAEYAKQGFSKESALKGFRSAFINHALTKSNNNRGLPNGDSLQKTLFGQIEGAPSDMNITLTQFMLEKGLADQKYIDDLQAQVKQISGIQEAFATNNFDNVLFKTPSLSKSFLIRIGGATAGSAFQQKLKSLIGLPQMSGGLIAEQTGSELMQRLLLRGPQTQRIKIMTEIFSNPKLLAEGLKKIKDKKDLDKALTVFEAVFSPLAKQAGRRLPIAVREIEEDDEFIPPEESFAPQAAVQQPQQNLMAQRFAQPTPTVIQPRQQPVAQAPAPRPTALSQGQANPAQRQRLAQLFPNDPLAQAAGPGGGIGSLFS